MQLAELTEKTGQRKPLTTTRACSEGSRRAKFQGERVFAGLRATSSPPACRAVYDGALVSLAIDKVPDALAFLGVAVVFVDVFRLVPQRGVVAWRCVVVTV